MAYNVSKMADWQIADAALFLPHTNADEFPSVSNKLAKLSKSK